MVSLPGRHRRRSLTRSERVESWVADRLPLGLRGRFALGAREIGLVALVGALALCAAAVVALRSTAAAATLTSSTRTPVGVTAGKALVLSRTGSVAGAQVVVDVAGSVVHPRVVTLRAGSRVYDALKAAGGAKPGVDLSGLNLARVVTDGEQIVVGRAAPSASSSGSAASPLVSLNRATEAELEALPGVGPVMAKSIVSWRSGHGPFRRIDDLQEVSGIGPKTFAKLKPLIVL